MKPLDLIYWLRAASGVLVGLFCGLFFSGSRGFLFGVAFYPFTYYVARLKWPRIKPRRVLLAGIGAYFFMWLLVWTLLHTLLG
ncbi:MAG: hypothetical protein ACE5OY_00860 [Candidatus Bathyarchaeia archaeon]